MSELYHHGILGQRWGKKNGPPYPLDAGDHSPLEKKMGWKKSLNKSSYETGKKNESEDSKPHKGLTSKQKKALIITGATLATAIVAYGVYKYKSMNPDSVQRGRDLLDKMIHKYRNTPLTLPSGADSNINGNVGGKIKETLEASLRNANPLGKNDNCTACSISGILRTLGIDASAKNCGERTLEELIGKGFKGVKGVEATAFGFGQSPEKAAAMLLKRYGDNAKGVCGVQWSGGRGGHAFSWIIENGKVTFLDFQSGRKGLDLNRFWNNIDRNGPLELHRLDDVLDRLDRTALSEFVDFH